MFRHSLRLSCLLGLTVLSACEPDKESDAEDSGMGLPATVGGGAEGGEAAAVRAANLNLVRVAVDEENAIVGVDKDPMGIGHLAVAPSVDEATIRCKDDDRRVGALKSVYST